MKFAPKLTALFIIIGAIIAAVMFTIVYFQVAKILERDISTRMENRVFFTMDVLDRFLYERLNDIKMFAKDPVISSEDATAEQVTERLIFFRNTYKCYASLSFFNLERIRIADTAGLQLGQQNRIERYWEDVLAGQLSAASDVRMSDTLNMPIIYFASAVKNKEGKAIGVVVARVPATRLFEMVKGSVRIQEEEEEEEIDLINKDGLLIYSNHNREGILKESLPEWESIKIAQREKIFGSVKHRYLGEKETMFYAFCRDRGYLDFKGNGWTIIAHIPTRVIFSPINKVLRVLITMFLIMLPGLILIISLFSKTVTRPLTRLSFAAAEIGKGKLDTVIEVKSKDEFGSLANTFNQMAADLKKTTVSIDNLNKEIAERKKVEDALRESEARYKALFAGTPEGILVADLQTRQFRYANPAMCGMFGYTKEEFSRIGMADIHPKESLDHMLAEFEAQARGEKLLSPDLPCLRKDGTLFYADISGIQMVLDGRKCSVGFFTDITERKRVQEQVRLAAEEWERTFDSITDLVFVHDKDMKIVRVNKACAKALKMDPKDIIGRKCYDLLHNSDHPWPACPFEKVKQDYVSHSEEVNDPNIGIPLFVTVSPIFGPGGEFMGAVHIAKDITERKKAEEKIKVFSDAIAGALDCFILTDTKGNITYANESAFRIFGYTPEEFLKLNVTKLDVDPRVGQEVLQEMAVKGKWSGEVANIRKNKEIFPSLLSAFIIKDDKGNPKAAMGIIRDITERKQAEQALEKLNKDLELAVLNLGRSNKELQDFAYVVSHDLKAPLRGIKTLAQWITTDYADKIDQNGRDQLNLMLSRADRMHNLIDGILQYSRVGRVKEEKVQVNLNELVAEVVDSIAPPQTISITVENDLPVIEFERTRIMQVFQNLLSNAVKYMDKPEGRIRIGCVEEGGFWKFSVADNGPGIEEKYFEKIFEMFQTLAPRDDVESTGVGLTVAKKIVELYGGRIWVESKVGEGSIFLFTLPKQETEVKDAQLQASIVG